MTGRWYSRTTRIALINATTASAANAISTIKPADILRGLQQTRASTSVARR
jgi:hypothetical protein